MTTPPTQPLTPKQRAAHAALPFIQNGMTLGVGTGSTVECLLDAIAAAGIRLQAAVSSSERSTAILQRMQVPVLGLESIDELDVYIDGADEIDPHLNLIKGGGGALTREKIVADAAKEFICIADASKQVSQLGAFGLPIEVLAFALPNVLRKAKAIGGRPVVRSGFTTDSGNVIVDVFELAIKHPEALEQTINNWPGVVANGLFALRKPERVLIGHENSTETLVNLK